MHTRTTTAVIDLGFGDSGKGITTSYLCSKHDPKNTIVVKSNGGQQSGHTVVVDGFRHIFSQFGSGTLQGFPTYISKFCTVSPPAMLKEYELIKQFNPVVFYDPLVMLTTPFDIEFNIHRNNITNHGTVGVGFGQTIQRNEDYYHLTLMDIEFEHIFKEKMKNIGLKYYQLPMEYIVPVIDEYYESCQILFSKNILQKKYWHEIYPNYNIIFESSQGIMLDQHHGIFPHVTRSNTTTKNMLELSVDLSEVTYVMRTYQTRHGNGFMTNRTTSLELDYTNGPETNKYNEFQREFRITKLDIDLICYALLCDLTYNSHLAVKRNLMVTCVDQHPIDFDWLLTTIQIKTGITFNKVTASYGQSYKTIEIVK